jgi:hypothetical protein
MFKFLRDKKTSKLIASWAKRISDLIDANEALKLKIDQVGILDGNQIISEFLIQNEIGIAYDHLIYMISASGVDLSENQITEITTLSKLASVTRPVEISPTLIELDEFYIILNLFNLAQIKTVEKLIEIWAMETPMKRDVWTYWSQNLHKKHQFKNDQGIKIFPHGFGLSYQDAERFIDFDFGENGEITGFDGYRLWDFIEENNISTLFTSVNQIARVVEKEVTKGKLEYSGYINYYRKTE